MAIFGGASALFGALTGIPYHWMNGDITLQTCLIVETGLVVLSALWAGLSQALLPGGRLTRASRPRPFATPRRHRHRDIALSHPPPRDAQLRLHVRPGEAGALR